MIHKDPLHGQSSHIDELRAIQICLLAAKSQPSLIDQSGCLKGVVVPFSGHLLQGDRMKMLVDRVLQVAFGTGCHDPDRAGPLLTFFGHAGSDA